MPLTIEDATTYLRAHVRRGSFDLLFDRPSTVDPVPRPTSTARSAMVILCAWLQDHPLPSDATWPDDASVLATRDLYLRHALALELRAQRPDLFRHVPWMPGHRHIVLAPDVEAQMAAAGPRGPAKALYAQMVLCIVWSQMARYEIFNTPASILSDIEEVLRTLSHRLDRCAERFGAVEGTDDGGEAPAFLLGVRALLDLMRGRIARAAGGSRLPDAEKLLTRALERYEERITSRADDRAREARGHTPRNERDPSEEEEGSDEERAQSDLMFSSSRSAAALLQLAYLNLLNSQCLQAESQLKTARLLALTTHDDILQSEIQLVALAVRRLTLSARDPQLPRKLRSLRAALERACAFNANRARSAYLNMALFQLILCDGYDDNDAWLSTVLRMRSGFDSDKPIEENSRASVFWRVSTELVIARMHLWRGFRVGTPSAREIAVERARPHLASAARLLQDPAGFANLAVDLHVYRAMAFMLERKHAEAREELRLVRGAEPTSGYTALPKVHSLIALLRIQLATDAVNWQRAARLRERFRLRRWRKLQVGWLRDYFDVLSRRIDAAEVLQLVSLDDLRREQEAALAPSADASRSSARHYTWDALYQRFVEQLYRATLEIAGPQAPTEMEWAIRWGTTPHTLCSASGHSDLSGHLTT